MANKRIDNAPRAGDARPASGSSAEVELAREQRAHDRDTARAVDKHQHTRERSAGPARGAGLDAGAHDRVDGGGGETVAAVNFDDDGLGHERGRQGRRQGTYEADGADSGELGPPAEQLSPTNQPRERGSQ